MKRVAKFLWSRMWYIIVAAIISAALLLSVIRLLLPLVTEYRSDVEQILTALLDQPVKIESLDATWRGFGPVLSLKNVELLDQDGETLLLGFNEARVGIDLWTSLVDGELTPSSLAIIGARLSVTRYKDGRVTVERLDLPAMEEGSGENLLTKWLFTQSSISLEQGEIYWEDRKRAAKKLHFSDISITLANAGNDHHLYGSVKLPESLGKQMEFSFGFEGDPLVAKNRNVHMNAVGHGIQLAQWTGEQGIFGDKLLQGTADFDLSARWYESNLHAVSGDLDLNGLTLATDSDGGKESFSSIKSYVELVINKEQWNARFRDLRITRNNTTWPQSNIDISANTEDGKYSIVGNYLKLEDVATLAVASNLLEDEYVKQIATLEPRGDIREYDILYSQNAPAHERLTGSALFNNVAMHQWNQMPELSGLDGLLRIDQEKGILKLDSKSIQLNVELMFREPIVINSLAGVLTWYHKDEAWHIRTESLHLQNKDMKGSLSMKLDAPDDGTSPYVYLTARFEDVVGASTSKYLPVTIMHPDTVEWLDRGIVSGDVVWADMILDGNLADFPFDNGEGKFEVRFNINDAILDYSEGWPRLEEVEAEVRFHGRKMDIHGYSGKILNSDISQVHAHIPDIDSDQPIMHLDGKASGTIADGLKYIAQSPLDRKFGNYFTNMDVDGRSNLAMDMVLPLRDGDERIKGTIELINGKLGMQGWGVEVENINGVLGFTEDYLQAEGVKAKLLGKDVKINIVPGKGKQAKGPKYSINTDIRLSASDLEKHFPHDIWSSFDGETDWHMDLIIPEADRNEEVSTDLVITSPLRGFSVNFPEPLKKAADKERPLKVDFRLKKDANGVHPYPRRSVAINYGADIKTSFIIQERPGGIYVERGQVSFGGDTGPLDKEGIYVSGRLKQFNMDDWADFMFASSDDKTNIPDVQDVIREVDLHIADMHMLEQRIADVGIKIVNNKGIWNASLRSAQVAGSIDWRTDVESQPVRIDLEHLYIDSFDDDEPVTSDDVRPDPTGIPPLQIKADKFVYNGNNLGTLVINTMPYDEGMTINKVMIDFENGSISGFGDWRLQQDYHVTTLKIKTNSDNLGSTMERFGYYESVSGGYGTFEADVHWLDTPMNFSLANINGTAHMNLKKGQLLDINPGAGRLFGLLSLQALPRRLTLDFTDLFKKGFSFDKISGDFEIENGNAYTNNLEMDSPFAKINIYGRTGLAAKDYDQFVSVNAKLTASLPLAGAIVGGPLVGAAVLALEKLILQPGLKEAARKEYTITGSWEDPVVTEVEPEADDEPDGTKGKAGSVPGRR